jgi:hypothetical protein
LFETPIEAILKEVAREDPASIHALQNIAVSRHGGAWPARERDLFIGHRLPRDHSHTG